MTAEQDFRSWLDHRDAEALGRAFDATGGRLLLLATQFADGAAAGELVQATFVAAMTRGDLWDRRRPLLPWLAGILQNEARMRWRSRRRRREVGIEALEPTATRAAGPLDASASKEVLDEVVRAIDTMPRTYRQVLRLRLVHELQPVEIARSLELPVGTVRAQLHRGLARLRAALPSGIGATVAALLTTDETLLAQVRAGVLEHARQLVPHVTTGTAAATAAGTGAKSLFWVLIMNTKLLAALGAVLLAVFLLTRSSEAPVPDTPVVTQDDHHPTAATATAPRPIAPIAGQREPVSPPTAPVWPLEVEVRDADGQPLEGAAVDVWTAPPLAAFWNRSSLHFLREDVAHGKTDALGVFRHDLESLRRRSAPWRETNTLWVEASMRGASADYQGFSIASGGLGEPLRVTLTLKNSRAVIGRLVDADARPVADADVQATKTVGGASTASAHDGTFVLAIDPDTGWPTRLVVHDRTHGDATIEVRPAAESASFVDVGDIVLAPGPSIVGRVTLGDGSAVAGAQVQVDRIDASVADDVKRAKPWLMQRDDRTRGARSNTDADGRFRFAGLEPDAVYLVDLWDLGGAASIAYTDGAPVELIVGQQLLTIEVVDRDGTPLPGAGIALDGFDPERDRASWSEREGAPPTGQVCGNYIPSGDDQGARFILSPFGYVWQIYTTDDAFRPVVVTHEALPGVHRATVRMVVEPEDRVGGLHVTAVDENGDDVPFGVALRAVDRDLYHDYRRTIKPPEGLRLELPAGRWHVDAVLGRELVWLHGDGGFARGEQQHDVVIQPGRTTELRLVAPAAGQVRFHLDGETLEPDTWRTLQFLHRGEAVEVLPIDRTDPRPATRQGAVVHDVVTRFGLPPGRHTFVVRGEGLHDATCHVDVEVDELAQVTVTLYPR